ncbi:phage tail domain-containing protein [Lentzea sp. CC55]|uniref:phage tail domain-containing protein n=1 Tax=Lentzea sp. CC55 TaxID=2884909 RepID=UPI0027E1A5C8|nr:phage tail domain-containing protein [Lentzea sp. CC55]MCG8926655.1 phage tail family protein [Lentzea sp. CC55]
MPRLQLESATDTFDLDDVLKKGRGVQALSGATGLGLPPVSVQWLSGAGDGARYRGRRVLPRDIDLPLLIQASGRDDLQRTLSRLAIMLAGPCTLRFVEDDGTSWTTEVVRVGGGDYVFGADTTGEDDLLLILTLRAGDPFFTGSVPTRKVVGEQTGVRGLLPNLAKMPVVSSQAIGQIQLENLGNADAFPTWEVTGPGRDFEAVSPGGERLHWRGTLAAGERLIIDTQRGTVVDHNGANRYAELAAAPRFWAIPPGLSSATAALYDISPGTIAPGAVQRTNLCPNPVPATLTNWQATGTETLVDAPWGGKAVRAVSSSGNSPFIFSASSTAAFAAGQTVSARCKVAFSDGATHFRVAMRQRDTSTYHFFGPVLPVPTAAWADVAVSGTTINAVPANNLDVVVLWYGSSARAAPPVGSVAMCGDVLIEAAGSAGAYFDGGLPDSQINIFEWTGEPHASASVQRGVITVGRSSIICSWRPRKWLVV